jgi:alkylation response protein AidB-like acyl-CoA dehydrogenase
MIDPLADLEPLLPSLRRRATVLDQSGAWPKEDLALLGGLGAMRWAVPHSAGGAGWTPLQLYLGYEMLASASMSVALILSQRDSAVGLLEGALPSPVAEELLSKLAGDQIFATIGIAQLTTSRQGGAPALLATPTNDGWQLDGVIPWATGAAKAEWVIVGATTVDNQQLLIALQTGLAGVTAQPPLPLVALRSSWTGQITCKTVRIQPSAILRGPVEKVLPGRKNSLPLGQAFLAMGLCRSGLDLIADHRSDGARAAHSRFETQFDELRTEILALSQNGRETEATNAASRIRGQCSDLTLRVMHAAVALYKGAALLADHPAQRLAREAMFLLVWSCPAPVIECTVDLLSEAR